MPRMSTPGAAAPRSIRPPVTLWLYTLSELLKLVALTTAVLVTVVAFAMSIKFLADGKLDPLDTIRAMFLAMVPALQYALPFAACFGATLAYHRLAADNELTAAYAGGISHRAILVPAAAMGIALALVLLLLSHLVIPRMLRTMAEMVTSDAARFFVSQIERGQSVEIGRTMVYADKALRQAPPPGYNDTLLLLGVLVVKLDGAGGIESHIAARSATVWTRPGTLNSGGGEPRAATEVIIRPTDFVGSGELVKAQSSQAVHREIVPSAFRDDPKFSDFFELQAMRKSPERLGQVNQSRAALARVLADREVVVRLRAALRDSGQIDLKKPDGERWLLRAAGLRPVRTDGKPDLDIYQIVPARGASVGLDRIMPDGKLQRQSTASALLRFPGPDSERLGASFTITLRDVMVDVVGSAPLEDEFADLTASDLVIGKAEGKERPIYDLALLSDPLDELSGKSSRELLDLAAARLKTHPADRDLLKKPVDRLTRQIDDLQREVLSKEHERYAHSIACLVMILIGSVMAMRLRDALPLTIYLWAFFPALLAMLTISGGQQLTHGQGPIGLAVLYSGVLGLAGYAVYEFVRLSRN